ncbi:Hypothetical protein CINCED_3A012819 [Cinara cedri]|uniref:Uncharacterized protein n=1 Tax=Cinara cedri TaxID=506608 RepID=A0A5E4MXV5_9HEMI|nr:Hypothetical protein CINCED_3A012819 [Cinara cedri]
MLVCTVCNDETYDNEDIKYKKCKIFLHFTYDGFRETNFRKTSAANKEKWCCENYKYSISELSNKNKLTLVKDCSNSDKLLVDLKNWFNFMSGQFDDHTMQLRGKIKSIKYVRNENKKLKEQNQKLQNEMSVVNNKINFIEQKLIENHIETVGILEQKNEDCIKILEAISKTLGGPVFVE